MKTWPGLILIFLFQTMSGEAMANSGTLTVSVTGLRSTSGYVAATLFPESAARGFPRKTEEAIDKKYIKIEDGNRLRLVFDKVPQGTYALALMHDENGDGKMKTLMGIPREGFGFSNNPKIYFGPPSFSKAKIQLEQPELEIEVDMKYLM